MSAIPAKTDFTGAARTEDQIKTWIEELHDYLTGLLGSDGVPATALAALGGLPEFSTGTRMLFQQTAAPTGWTKVSSSTYNDAALRIVTGAVGTGGADNFSTHFGTGKTSGSTVLTTSQIPAHAHGVTDAGHTHGLGGGAVIDLGGVGFNDQGVAGLTQRISATNSATTGITIQNAGGGGGHDHTLSAFNIKYADVIIATKD